MENSTKQKLIDEKYEELSLSERRNIYDSYFKDTNPSDLKTSLENIIFYKKPPTPKEFLDPKNEWLPENVINSIYPHIKKEFCTILDNKKCYDKVVEYGGTRLGKSFLARLLIIYTIVFIHHIREPAMFYGLSPLTELCIYIISFKLDKSKQIYLQHIYKLLKKSKRFMQVARKDFVAREQEKAGIDTIVWSRPAESGFITLASGLQIQMGNSDVLSAIGSDILQAYVSEIGFFCEYAGTTEEEIYRVATDIAERISATVGRNYLAYLYLDTSANNADSLIENYIIKELQYRENTHFNWQSRWQARPHTFPIWQRTGDTFKVIAGNGSIPAQIVTDERQLENVPLDIIIDVPIDAKQKFEDNLIKSIKDICGFPTQAENKFIDNIKIINTLFNNKTLLNIEGGLILEASLQPEKQIWEKVKDKFFFKNVYGKYTIKRAPKEIRYIGIDLSHSTRGDAGGFCLLHKEWSMEKDCVMYIVDFCFSMLPGEKGISLDAPFYFATDLQYEGSISIHALFTDSFQSKSGQQFLERHNIKPVQQSIENVLSPHQFVKTCLITEQLKGGRNIFLKNNLQSLITTRSKSGKEKVDHRLGNTNNKYFGDFDNSTCGINANDVSDAVTQALFGAFNHSEYIPSTIYENENKRFSTDSDTIEERVNNLLLKI